MAGLAERLNRLRGGAAPTADGSDGSASRAAATGTDRDTAAPRVEPAHPAAEPPPTLAERLRRLAPRRVGAASLHGRAQDEAALADALGAEPIAPGVLRLERRRPLAERHGRFRLGDLAGALPALLPAAPADPGACAILDTETSGLAGGTGTWVFACGIARVAGDHLALSQLLLTRLDAEPAFLAALSALLADCALLVSYNGKSFDLPLIATRFRLAALDCPAEHTPHLDLLHPVRRAFAARWPDCRLASVEQRLLGVQRRDDLPGAEAPAAWRAWLRDGDGRGLGAVLRHNRWDLLAVAALLPALAAVERDPLGFGADVGAVARQLARRGEIDTARALLAAAEPALGVAETLLLAALHRRRGDWAAAEVLWRRLAAVGEPAALEALAKLNEHRARDPQTALRLARQLPPGPARERRCRRLADKLATGRQLPLSSS